ncbi:MAG: phosphate ABC transporter substrate-binding protein [Candidatus Omnitrophota bacterium]|jgi:phosphate transport system substrate-binding protein
MSSRFKQILTLALFFIFTLSLAFAKPQEDSLQIKGSDTMVNLAQAWAEDFMQKNPNSFIAVTGGGSGTGIASLINGTCDIAMTSRTIKPKEIEFAKKRNVFPFELKVALDGLAVIVHPQNPIKELTIDQLAKIFSGKIVNWKEVGGEDKEIVILSREVNSGTHVYFKEHVLRHNDPSSQEEFAPKALLLSSSQAIADEVATNPSAIGYYGMGYISKRQKAIAIAQDEKSVYVEPTVDNVTNQSYPISRPLYVYTNAEPQGFMKTFIDFALSPEGQKVVLTSDFVPLIK